MFDPLAGLIPLRDKSNNDPNLLQVMRNYRVPVGLTEEEQEKAMQFFNKKKEQVKWYQFNRKKEKLDLHYDNKNSRVIYLMGPDNSFLQFYNLDIDTNELAE